MVWQGGHYIRSKKLRTSGSQENVQKVREINQSDRCVSARLIKLSELPKTIVHQIWPRIWAKGRFGHASYHTHYTDRGSKKMPVFKNMLRATDNDPDALTSSFFAWFGSLWVLAGSKTQVGDEKTMLCHIRRALNTVLKVIPKNEYKTCFKNFLNRNKNLKQKVIDAFF